MTGLYYRSPKTDFFLQFCIFLTIMVKQKRQVSIKPSVNWFGKIKTVIQAKCIRHRNTGYSSSPYSLYPQNWTNLDPFLELSSNSAHSTPNMLKQIIKHYIEQNMYNYNAHTCNSNFLAFCMIFSFILKFREFSLIKT